MTTYMVINPKELVSELKLGVLDILFEKKDGTTRLLKGTLNPLYFGKPFPANEAQARADSLVKEGETQVPVMHCWDVEAQDWRSFRTDHVISVQITNG